MDRGPEEASLGEMLVTMEVSLNHGPSARTTLFILKSFKLLITVTFHLVLNRSMCCIHTDKENYMNIFSFTAVHK